MKRERESLAEHPLVVAFARPRPPVCIGVLRKDVLFLHLTDEETEAQKGDPGPDEPEAS